MRRRRFVSTAAVSVLAVLNCPLPFSPSERVAAAQTRTVQNAARAADAAGAIPTLLCYNTVQQFLAGDLNHAVPVATVRADLAAYPEDWPVAGVGSTDLPGNGELIVDGTAADVHFWWANPRGPDQADLAEVGIDTSSPDVRLPILVMAVADPSRALTFAVANVPDVHAWLTDQMTSLGIELAGVQLQGDFGPVQTTVAFNVPPTGLDLSDGHTIDDYFRPINYAAASWTMDGMYVAAAPLQPIINRTPAPIHLHGYQTDAMLGGHIAAAPARNATVTVWPLDQLTVRHGPLAP